MNSGIKDINVKKVSILGVGLIGGSLGMALRRRKYKVVGVGRNIKKLKLAKKLGAVDEYTIDWEYGVKDADIVVICTPVNLVAPTLKKLLPFLKPNAIITDVGSVKGSIIKGVNSVLRKNKVPGRGAPVFIGAHPLAGSEKAGVKFAKRNLYNKAAVVITHNLKAPQKAVNEIKRMWQSAGADVLFIKSDVHDRIVALISHLPHILAFSLCSAVGRLNTQDNRTSKLLAGSFRDMTRIADSSPTDWSVICQNNHKELDKIVGDFVKQLLAIKKKLASQKQIEKVFQEAKLARQKLLNIS